MIVSGVPLASPSRMRFTTAGVRFVGRPVTRFRVVRFGFDWRFLAAARLTLRCFARATHRQTGGVVPENIRSGIVLTGPAFP
jgi:hypothetical protein